MTVSLTPTDNRLTVNMGAKSMVPVAHTLLPFAPQCFVFGTPIVRCA